MNAWVLLALAILCEIAGTSLLKASQGFAKPLFGVASMSCYGLCFWLLAFAFTRIPMGIHAAAVERPVSYTHLTLPTKA